MIHVYSEIGKLKTVMVHRPGNELKQIHPSMLEEMLFEDTPFLPSAQEEHDIFTGILRDAGIDSLKIEGRMKSVYYVAMVTRAHRKALDALEGKITDEEAAPYIAELDNVAHRESTTGFYYNKSNADETTTGASDSKYQLAAEIGEEITGAAFDKLLAEGIYHNGNNYSCIIKSFEKNNCSWIKEGMEIELVLERDVVEEGKTYRIGFVSPDKNSEGLIFIQTAIGTISEE